MENADWVQIRSWHIIKLTRSILPITLCGRHTKEGAKVSNELHSGKSCESCLRIYARRVDKVE